VEPLARTVNATRSYGPVIALDGVSLDVPAGQLLGLLGPNGAGKTTLLQLLAGLRRPTSGTVEIFGGDPREASRRRRLGSTPQETGLPPTLRVQEVVDFVAGHFDHPVPTGELLEQFGLTGLNRRQTGGLSGGQKRRLAVAVAFVGRPDLVLLDEPTTGLDVEARHGLWDAVRVYHRGGGTVVLTSHYLQEVEALAERVVVIDQGQVRADGTLAQVRSLGPGLAASGCGPRPCLSWRALIASTAKATCTSCGQPTRTRWFDSSSARESPSLTWRCRRPHWKRHSSP